MGPGLSRTTTSEARVLGFKVRSWLGSLLSLLTLLAIPVGACSSDTPAVASKPNIIVILVDDIGVGDFGFSGGRDFPTPNIDRFTKEGVIFSHGYAMPSCSPTRAALLTGRYQIRRP